MNEVEGSEYSQVFEAIGADTSVSAATVRLISLAIGLLALNSCGKDSRDGPLGAEGAPVMHVVQYLPRANQGHGGRGQPSGVVLSVTTSQQSLTLSKAEFDVGEGGAISNVRVTCEDNPNQAMCGGSPPPDLPPAPTNSPVPPEFVGTADGALLESLWNDPNALQNVIATYVANLPRQANRVPGYFNTGLNLLAAEEMVIGGARLRAATYVDHEGRRVRSTLSTEAGVPLVAVTRKWSPSDQLLAYGLYLFRPDGTPLTGYEVAVSSDLSPIQRYNAVVKPSLYRSVATSCFNGLKIVAHLALPSELTAQGTSGCDRQKRNLIISTGFATAAVGTVLLPGFAAACGSNPYATARCMMWYTAAGVAFGTSLDDYSDCLEALPENRALREYYQTPTGARDIEFALGSGNVTGSLLTFTSQFSTPSYILQQLRDQYNANHAASVPIGSVIWGTTIGVTYIVDHVPAGGGGRSATNFIDWILEKFLQVPKQ